MKPLEQFLALINKEQYSLEISPFDYGDEIIGWKAKLLNKNDFIAQTMGTNPNEALENLIKNFFN